MKGVNKLVVEVRPEDGYFEKALLFIRPEKQDVPQKELSDSADRLFHGIETGGIRKRTRSFLLILSGAIAGSSLTFFIAFISGII